MLFLEILLGSVFLAWLGLGALAFWSTRGITLLGPEQAIEPLPGAPRVSIILSARHEEEALPATLDSLLKLDYPDYEVILVDDDSTDRTGHIAEEWARRPEAAARLKVIHNRELPPGWSGKVHALNLAARAASGEWILATDADVVFHPSVLRRAMSCALGQGAHLLSLAPEFLLGSFWEKTVLPAFSFLLATLFPLRLVNQPGARRALAAGAFILTRRDDLEALGGYARLRNVVIEDVRLCEMFKRNGRRVYLALTRGLLRTRMYRGWREMWEGLSRSAFEGTGYSLVKTLVGVAVGVLLGVFPWVTALVLAWRDAWRGQSPTSDLALVLALATCLLSSLVYLPFLLAFRLSPFYLFTLPLSAVFYSGVALNSAWKSIVGSGIPWKGRHYRPSV